MFYSNGRWWTDFKVVGQRYTDPTDFTANNEATKKKVKKLQEERKALKKAEWREAESNRARNKRGAITDQPFDEAIADYYVAQGQHAKGHGKDDIRRNLNAINEWLAEIGPNFMLGDLDTATIIRLREKRRVMTVKWRTKDGKPPIDKKTGKPKVAKTISARTCNIMFEHLKFALSWLEKNGREVQTINWDVIFLEEVPRETDFTPKIEAQVFASFREDYHDALEFATLAGPRKGQVVDVKWTDIDWNYECIRLKRQKKQKSKKPGKPLLVPITARMKELILRQIDPDTNQPYHPVYVFTYVAQRTYINQKAGAYYEEGERYPITYEGLSTAWARWKKQHGVENCRLHDIRHAFGRRTQAEGRDILATRDAMGHGNIATTERYTGYSELDKIRAAMEAGEAARLRERLASSHNNNHNKGGEEAA